jgi:exopolysaccharide biosynthesis polyprenyl glycosylphosphotransferase
MFRRFSPTYALYSMVLDGVLAGLSLIIAYATRPLYNEIPGVQDILYPMDPPILLYGIFPVMWVSILLIFSVYDGRKNFRVVDEFANVTSACLLAAVAMAGVLYLSYREMSRFTFFVFWLQTYGLLIFWRTTARLVFRWRLGNDVNSRRVLILGTGEGANRLKEIILQQRGLGLELVGFLEDASTGNAEKASVLGTLDQVRQVVKEKNISDVVVALPGSAHQRLNWAVAELHDLPVKVWVIPDYFSLALHHATVEEFAGIPMLDLRAPALSEYQRMVKRAFDLVLTILSLPVSLPVMGIIALFVRLDSPGPVFYWARRVGENGRLFNMQKFRTMVQKADQFRHLVERVDEQGKWVYKTPDDPRVTRVGRFLRRTSLDELPQIFNVLRGEMSLVGPRPEMPDLVDQYEPWQRTRFAVPQGMTGWWQIHGRSDKPMHLHTDEDLFYVQHYSIWLDMQIILNTIWVVLRGKGAY